MKFRIVPLFLSFALSFALCFAGSASAQTTPGTGYATTGMGFGATSAVGQNEVFVGAAPLGWPQGDGPPGTVYRFVRESDGNWVEAQRLVASDGIVGDYFGRSVAGDGSLLVIGAPGLAQAYVFEKGASGDWIQTGILSPSHLTDGAEFGGQFERGGRRTGSIAIAGDRVVVSSYDADTNTGALHVFVRTGGAWEEEALLSSGESGDGFGHSVAGAPGHVFTGASAANESKGVVYVSQLSNGSWQPLQSITSPEIEQAVDEDPDVQSPRSAGRALLGATVVYADGLLYASASAFERSGAVFVFAGSGGHWVQVGRLSPPEPEEGQRPFFGFGADLAVSDQNVLVTAGGMVLVYGTNDIATITGRLMSPDDRAERSFGTGLSTGGNVAVIGSPSADYEAGVATLFERMPNGTWEAKTTLISEISNLEAITGDEVRCEDGDAGGFSCSNVDLVSFMPVDELTFDRGVTMTDIWGWEDPVTGKEWVLIGRTEGVSIVDISNPGHPVFVGQLPKTEGVAGSSWRDVKTYKNYAYVVSDGVRDHGIQVLDLNQLRDVDPADMPVTFEETYIYDGIGSAHNIIINEETGFAYAVGGGGGTYGQQCGGQLHVVSLANPAKPEFVGCFREGNGGTHDAQCVIYHGPDDNYQGREICINSNGGNGFVIADVTDKDNPETVAVGTYPMSAYTHQGWLTEDHHYFYMNDELDELNGLVNQTRTLIWDVSDLEDPTLVSQYLLDSGASDHNLYIRDNYMYESNYLAGLKVLDISDPLNPVEVGHFDTAPFGDDVAGFGGSWSNYPYFKSGIIAVSSRGEGLFLVRNQNVDL